MIIFNYHKNINNILIGMQLKFLKLIASLKFNSPVDLEAQEKAPLLFPVPLKKVRIFESEIYRCDE